MSWYPSPTGGRGRSGIFLGSVASVVMTVSCGGNAYWNCIRLPWPLATSRVLAANEKPQRFTSPPGVSHRTVACGRGVAVEIVIEPDGEYSDHFTVRRARSQSLICRPVHHSRPACLA